MKHVSRRLDQSYAEVLASLGDPKNIFGALEETTQILLRNLAARIEWKINDAAARKQRQPIVAYQPFPIDVLPGVVGSFVREAGTAIGCDASFIALPLLACLARAIGNVGIGLRFIQDTRLVAVGNLQAHHVDDLLLQFGVEDRKRHFDARVDVAHHKVRRT